MSHTKYIAQTLDLQKRYDVSAEKGASVKGDLGYTSELQIKASRWRAERNWWISALTFVIYWYEHRITLSSTLDTLTQLHLGRCYVRNL